jgi:hypothetical protein
MTFEKDGKYFLSTAWGVTEEISKDDFNRWVKIDADWANMIAKQQAQFARKRYLDSLRPLNDLRKERVM